MPSDYGGESAEFPVVGRSIIKKLSTVWDCQKYFVT